MDNKNIKLSPKLAEQAKTMDDQNQQYILDMLKNLDKRIAAEKTIKDSDNKEKSAK